MQSPLGNDLIWLWNILVTIGTLVYIFGIIGIMEKLVDKKILSSDLSRKVIHVAAGSWIIFWFFYDKQPGDFTWLLNIAVPALFFLTFLYKGMFATPEDKDVKTMTRTGDPKELLKGPLYFTITMITMGTIFYGSYAGALAMAVVGWGDGLAPYFGKKYGSKTYKTFGREKTLEGTLAMFIFSIIGGILFVILLQPVLAPFSKSFDLLFIFMVVLLVAVIATIVEALSPADIDNLLIPLSTIVVCLLVDAFAKSSLVVLSF